MIASTQTNHPLHGSSQRLDAKSRVDSACASLRGAGLRITQPRIAILGVLIGRTQPVSIEQIHAELRDHSCDLVTVYRCLAAFEEIGLVRRSFLHNGTSLYQLSDRKETSYHVVSKDGSTIHSLDDATSACIAGLLKGIENELKTAGYTEISHLLQFFANSPATPDQAAARALAGQVKIASAK
jgi:Fur family ferric uptake transcriptional regulator